MNRIQRSAKRCFPLTRGAQNHVQKLRQKRKQKQKQKGKRKAAQMPGYYSSHALAQLFAPPYSFFFLLILLSAVASIVESYHHTHTRLSTSTNTQKKNDFCSVDSASYLHTYIHAHNRAFCCLLVSNSYHKASLFSFFFAKEEEKKEGSLPPPQQAKKNDASCLQQHRASLRWCHGKGGGVEGSRADVPR